MVEVNPEFEPRKETKKKKELSEVERLIKEYRKGTLKSTQDWDNPETQDNI